MDTPTILTADDRCRRSAYLGKEWERNILRPHEILRRAIEAGLESEEEDFAQAAGDEHMTICTERGIDIKQNDQYGAAMHGSALADMVAWVVRGQNRPWERPEDLKVGREPWISSAFLDPSGVRLRRVLTVERWSDERALAESHAWYNIGEVVAYELPLFLTVVVLGQRRDARWSGPFSSGWVHPVNRMLRMRKRDGKGFGGNWSKVFREETEYSREHWLDSMTQDGILGDVVFEVEVPVPEASAKAKISWLMEKKLAEIKGLNVLPDPCPSQCNSPIDPCQFEKACWNFELPTTNNGFIQITI